MADLDRALALTTQMLAAAQAGEWARLVELEAERAPLLESGLDASMLARMGRIIEIDKELRRLVAVERDHMADAWQDETRRHRAINAYRKA